MNIPEGWPTKEMQVAGAQAIRIDTTVLNKIWTANVVFKAMLEASPPTINDVVVTTNETGRVVAVTRQDEEGKILSVIWEALTPPAQEWHPDGSWLWIQLMDWCKKRGVHQGDYNDLFEMVNKAHEFNSKEKMPAWSESGEPLNLEAAAERLLNCLENETVNKDIEKEMDNLRKFLGES